MKHTNRIVFPSAISAEIDNGQHQQALLQTDRERLAYTYVQVSDQREHVSAIMQHRGAAGAGSQILFKRAQPTLGLRVPISISTKPCHNTIIEVGIAGGDVVCNHSIADICDTLEVAAVG